MLNYFALNLVVTHLLSFFMVTKGISDWHNFILQVKVSVVNSAGGSFCWNYATDTFYSNYAVKTPVVILWVLRFYCNYAGGTFCYSYAGGSFCCNYAGDSFCSKYVGDNFYYNYPGGSLCYNYAGGIFSSALCT